MKIKFLSFIASFFMVSMVITSCLDNENTVEYSSDAIIHAFELDTIGYGKTYKFTIDQLKGEIYNEDSLPVHADTIIDRILIKTLTTASGIVTMKDRNDQDSIINISDSIDFRKPIKIKVWSTEAAATLNGKTRDYTINVRVHKHDPDSLRWSRVGNMNNSITNAQKTIKFKNEYLTYSLNTGQLKVYKNNSLSNWTAGGANTTGSLTNVLPNSILALDDIIFATANKQAYQSTDGVNWEPSAYFSGDINTFISTLPADEADTRITYIKTEKAVDQTDVRYLCSILKSELGVSGKEKKEVADAEFPVDNISFTTIGEKTKYYRNIIVGKHDPAIEITINKEKKPIAKAWGYDGNTWTKLGTTSATAYCPAYSNPTIVYYNNLLYVFGDKFESIYVSETEGIAWKKANKKFSFPYQNWKEQGFVPNDKKPEFRGRTNYSVVQDVNSHYIYILFSKGDNVTFTEEVKTDDKNRATSTQTHTYSHDSEVWRGRLNQLWFDLDPANAGK